VSEGDPESPGRRTLPFSRAAATSRTGPQHAECEDRFRILDGSHPAVADAGRGCLYVVCDGVSTVPRGRWAAEVACARVEDFFARTQTPRLSTLVQLLTEIDWELRSEGAGQAACTLSLLWLAWGRAHVVHLGDSEVFRVRHGEVTRIASRATGGGLGTFLGMGVGLSAAIQTWSEPLFTGDLFLLVTDGVTEVLAVEDLLDTWWAFQGDPRRVAAAVIAEVDRRRGHDDATALVVDVLGVETDPDDPTHA
jgi:serine/threonine protein phosphatase PrpC